MFLLLIKSFIKSFVGNYFQIYPKWPYRYIPIVKYALKYLKNECKGIQNNFHLPHLLVFTGFKNKNLLDMLMLIYNSLEYFLTHFYSWLNS